MFSIPDSMLINSDTLASLQIVQSESHPNHQTGGTGKSSAGIKESLSICGLLNPLAGTPQGRRRLRQMLLLPLTDLELIRERHHMIAVLLRPENAEALKAIRISLRKLPDLKKTLGLLQKGVETAGGRGSVDRGAWWTLTKFALNSLNLRDSLSQLQPPNTSKIQAETMNSISVNIMKQVGELVSSTIDFEEAKTGSRIAVKWGLNDELDNLKREYIGLPDLLSQISSAISQ